MPLPPPLPLPWQSPTCPPQLAVGAAAWPRLPLVPVATLALGRHDTPILLARAGGGGGRAVVLKRLPSPAAAAAEAAAAAAAAAAAPAAVLATYAAYEEEAAVGGGGGVLVLERAAASARAAARRAGGFLVEADAAAAVAGVLRALVGAHDMGFVHGDVKSENVFLVARGRAHDAPPAFVLGDWGSAASVGAPPPATTPAARPPAPSPVAAPADDVWAVGALTVELLTGGEPRFKNGAPVLPSHLSPAARAVATAALAPVGGERPGARELLGGAVREWRGEVGGG